MATSRGALVGELVARLLLASALTHLVSACGNEDMAPFFDPRDDGGVAGANSSSGNGNGPSGMAGEGSSSSGDNFLGRSGDPSIFDPDQVYVRGAFDSEGLNITDARAGFCDDAPSVIADWSSPENDLETPQGVTAATTCESRDLIVRLDGTIVYIIAGASGKLFVEEKFELDGSTLVFNMGTTRPHQSDIEAFTCSPFNGRMRHWLDPETGASIYVCWRQTENNVWAPEHHIAGSMDPLDVPSGYTIIHLGIQGYALLRKLDAVNELAVWNRDDDSMVELTLEAFQYERIYAVRATPTGFLMLVVDSPDPIALSRWEVAYDGALVGPLAPSFVAPNHRLDNSNCDRQLFGSPTSENPEFLPNRGCMCALEATEAAVCIVEDVRGDENPQLVVRFDSDGSDPEVVFDAADDDYITEVTGLFTGD